MKNEKSLTFWDGSAVDAREVFSTFFCWSMVNSLMNEFRNLPSTKLTWHISNPIGEPFWQHFWEVPLVGFCEGTDIDIAWIWASEYIENSKRPFLFVSKNIAPFYFFASAYLLEHRRIAMRAILDKLKREGLDLDDKWSYKGSDPKTIREKLKSLGSDDEVRLAMDAIAMTAAVNFYGTNPAENGAFSRSAKQRGQDILPNLTSTSVSFVQIPLCLSFHMGMVISRGGYMLGFGLFNVFFNFLSTSVAIHHPLDDVHLFPSICFGKSKYTHNDRMQFLSHSSDDRMTVFLQTKQKLFWPWQIWASHLYKILHVTCVCRFKMKR